MTTKYGLLVSKGNDIDLVDFQEMVSINAYYRAEKRGFKPGHDMDDWLEAQLEIIEQYCYSIGKCMPTEAKNPPIDIEPANPSISPV